MGESRTPVSVIVCARDEEAVIGRCLASVGWPDERVVVDSGSAAAPKELAEASVGRVVGHEWAGFAAQKNYAARVAAHDWVLSLDADEIVTPELGDSIRAVLDGPMDPHDGYVVDRRGDFLGVVLPNGA